MIDPDIQQSIQDELARIEEQENVHIFYACESGSRAWGFESQDSDFDVRFLYIHPMDWYLSIDQKRDVIEKPIDDVLDVSGWDIRKSLLLLKKSNPPFLEWMQSPIIYKENAAITSLIGNVMPDYYSPISCMYHYLHMAQGNLRDYLKEEVVWVKKYLYVLRPVLACMWIERDLGLVPIEFQKLVDAIVKDSELRNAIEDLIQRKKAGKEIDRGPKIPVISEFIEIQLNRLSSYQVKPPKPIGFEKLNDVFRKSLKISEIHYSK